jgi:hypothetical protein
VMSRKIDPPFIYLDSLLWSPVLNIICPKLAQTALQKGLVPQFHT